MWLESSNLLPLCFIAQRQCGDAGCCHNRHQKNKSFFNFVCQLLNLTNVATSLALSHLLSCMKCNALWRICWWKCALHFEDGWNVKEHLFLPTSGEELFLMSAVCGFPTTFFDLFLESNVMIVAHFEIWKHSCCVSLQSCFARLSLALQAALCCCFIY